MEVGALSLIRLSTSAGVRVMYSCVMDVGAGPVVSEGVIVAGDWPVSS